MNELTIFNFNENQVRTVLINNEPYFVGKDVADILGYQNASKALMDHVDEEDKVNNESLSSLGQRGGWLINESGLYSLVLSSKLPQARTFKRWVTSDVLPKIRKTGGYTVPQTFAEALRSYALEVEKNEKLQLENKAMQPKTEFYDQVTDSKDAVEMQLVSKVLNIKGMGRNNLFQFLREQKILQGDNKPYQTYVDRGYFRVIMSKWNTPNGDVHENYKTIVYPKGIDFIRRKLKENGYS